METFEAIEVTALESDFRIRLKLSNGMAEISMTAGMSRAEIAEAIRNLAQQVDGEGKLMSATTRRHVSDP